MEINSEISLASLNSGMERLDGSQQPNPRAAKTGERAINESDRIELSIRSREIQHLDELIRSAPDIRDTKVEKLRSAIEEGTYNIRAEKIADKILSGKLIDEVF